MDQIFSIIGVIHIACMLYNWVHITIDMPKIACNIKIIFYVICAMLPLVAQYMTGLILFQGGKFHND